MKPRAVHLPHPSFKSGLWALILLALMAPLAGSGSTVSAADPADRVLNQLTANSTGGTVGVYLRQVGSSTAIAASNENFVFEPASTIKSLIHFHAMRQVQDGAVINGAVVTLNTAVPHFTDYDPADNSCPIDSGTPAVQDTLQQSLTEMMNPSDNARTQALRVFFGEANIDATAVALQMNNSLLQHRIGCGADAVANHNRLTLVDAGTLFERVATNYLNAATRATAFEIMINESLDAMIDSQAAGLSLPPDVIADFKAASMTAIKDGFYRLTDGNYTSAAGWATIPFLQNCVTAPREYVFGAFIHDATTLMVGGPQMRTISIDLLREQVRAALESWDACADFKVIAKLDNPDPVEAGKELTYTVTIKNNGPSQASATVTDILPAHLSFVSCNAAPLGVCTGAGNNRTVTFADVPKDGIRTFTLAAVAKCSVADGTVIKNTATVASSKTDSIAGNDSGSSDTTVVNPKPTINTTLTTEALWSTNHDLVNVGLAATADDGPCTAPAEFQVSVFSNEDDETPNPPHSPDAKSMSLTNLRLRAERTGSGDGRVYLIVVKATDEAGQTGFDTVTVIVPKSQSKEDVDAVNAQAAAAKAYADSHNGLPPPGYVTVGDGPVLGPNQ